MTYHYKFVPINPNPFLQLTAGLDSDLPPSNQQQKNRTKTPSNIFFWSKERAEAVSIGCTQKYGRKNQCPKWLVTPTHTPTMHSNVPLDTRLAPKIGHSVSQRLPNQTDIGSSFIPWRARRKCRMTVENVKCQGIPDCLGPPNKITMSGNVTFLNNYR